MLRVDADDVPILLFAGFLVLVLVTCFVWLARHPCLRESSEETIQGYTVVGNVAIPMYGHACLERK